MLSRDGRPRARHRGLLRTLSFGRLRLRVERPVHPNVARLEVGVALQVEPPAVLLDEQRPLDEVLRLNKPLVDEAVQNFYTCVPRDAVRLLIHGHRVVDHELEELGCVGKVQDPRAPRVPIFIVFFVARVRRVDDKIGLPFHVGAVPRLEDVVWSRGEARRLVVVQALAAELVRDLRALRRGLGNDQRLARRRRRCDARRRRDLAQRRRRCDERCCSAGPEEQLQGPLRRSVVWHCCTIDQH